MFWTWIKNVYFRSVFLLVFGKQMRLCKFGLLLSIFSHLLDFKNLEATSSQKKKRKKEFRSNCIGISILLFDLCLYEQILSA